MNIRCKELLGVGVETADEPEPLGKWWERLLALTGIDFMLCPRCRTGRQKDIPRSRGSLHLGDAPTRCQ